MVLAKSPSSPIPMLSVYMHKLFLESIAALTQTVHSGLISHSAWAFRWSESFFSNIALSQAWCEPTLQVLDAQAHQQRVAICQRCADRLAALLASRVARRLALISGFTVLGHDVAAASELLGSSVSVLLLSHRAGGLTPLELFAVCG